MSRTVNITIPDDPTLCDGIALLHAVGPLVKVAVNAMIAHDPNAERVAILKLRVRSLLDTAGYIAQAAYGLA